MPCNMNLPKAGVVSTRATDFSSLDPFRKLLLCCVFLLVLIVLVNSSAWAQQNVFSRSEVSTGNWWDNANPWYYQVWNNSQNRPDNNSGTRNYLKIGHNNNLTMKQVERVRSNSAKRDEIVAEKPKVNTPVVPVKVAAPVVKK